MHRFFNQIRFSSIKSYLGDNNFSSFHGGFNIWSLEGGSLGRPRERFRERENGRSSNEGSTRGGSGNLQPEVPITTSSSMAASPTIVLSGSRQFSGQLPTILQSRDRQDDSSSLYEENLDGSKDSGDTGSIGDPELVSAFDGPSSGYGSQRHSSRGSKSRQTGERRERDNRREGKWERKHS